MTTDRRPRAASAAGAGLDAPLIVVSVGTDHHPFERLVRWMDEVAAADRSVRVIIQRGSAPPTASAESQPLIPHAELCALFADAAAVVSHGGPSTVMDARAAGKLPIVLARDPSLGEHVDDHQLRFANHVARNQLARVVRDRDGLIAAVADSLGDPSAFTVPVGVAVPPGVVGFGRIVDDLLGATTPLTTDAEGRA